MCIRDSYYTTVIAKLPLNRFRFFGEDISDGKCGAVCLEIAAG